MIISFTDIILHSFYFPSKTASITSVYKSGTPASGSLSDMLDKMPPCLRDIENEICEKLAEMKILFEEELQPQTNKQTKQTKDEKNYEKSLAEGRVDFPLNGVTTSTWNL